MIWSQPQTVSHFILGLVQLLARCGSSFATKHVVLLGRFTGMPCVACLAVQGNPKGEPTVTRTAYAEDPLAPHSAQFPLGRLRPPESNTDTPSTARAWNLRWMRPTRPRPGLPPQGSYDPVAQVSLGVDGMPVNAQPTANSVSDSDGDEGKSEDWTYDAVPDNPYQT